MSALIAVTDNNEIWINKSEVELRDVRAVAEKIKKENPQGQWVIQADKKSHSGQIVDILEQLNFAGVSGVHIATEKDN